jgi:hypothetical protein
MPGRAGEAYTSCNRPTRDAGYDYDGIHRINDRPELTHYGGTGIEGCIGVLVKK